jgi:hypothetical protein
VSQSGAGLVSTAGSPLGRDVVARDVVARPTRFGVLLGRPGQPAAHVKAVVWEQLIGRSASSAEADVVRSRLTERGFLALPAADMADRASGSPAPQEISTAGESRRPRFAVSRNGIEVDVLDPVAHRVARMIPAGWARPLWYAGIAVAGSAFVWWVVQLPGGGMSSESVVKSRGALAVFVMLTVWRSLATCTHELGHAVISRYFGARVGRFGLGPYWGGVSAYVDSTPALSLPRRARLIQAGGGVLAEGVLIALCAVWATLRPSESDVAVRFAATCGMSIVVNLVPLLQLDGYWLLSDSVEDPELHERSQAALARWVRRRGPMPELSATLQRRYVIYAAVSLVFGVALLTMSAVLWFTLSRDLVSGLWQSGSWQRMGALWVAVTGGLSLAIALLASVLPSVAALTQRSDWG